MARDVPEDLTHGREREYLDRFYTASPYDPTAFAAADIAEYLRCYSSPGGMRAGFEWYRALVADARDVRAASRTPLQIPVLALGGAHRMGDRVRASCAQVAEDVEGVIWERCGHYPHEEHPEQLAALLRGHFAKPTPTPTDPAAGALTRAPP